MMKAVEKTGKGEVVAASTNSNLPSYLAGHTGGSGLKSMETSDFTIPRIKLLQGISPEVEAFEAAKAGYFWLNVMDQLLGSTIDIIVCADRKRVLLLPPIGDARGILARADDGKNWTPPDGEWEVKLKNVKKPVVWATKPTVRESGLLEFGSSNPEDPDSNPAATLFYEYLVYLPKYPQFSPVLFSLARSQAKRAKDLNGKIEFRGAPMQSQIFTATPTNEKGPEGGYFNVAFASNGFADEETYKKCVAITDRFKDYRGADEEGAAREASGGTGAPVGERGNI